MRKQIVRLGDNGPIVEAIVCEGEFAAAELHHQLGGQVIVVAGLPPAMNASGSTGAATGSVTASEMRTKLAGAPPPTNIESDGE